MGAGAGRRLARPRLLKVWRAGRGLRYAKRLDERPEARVELKTLTYTSRADLDLKASDVTDIHQVARRLNALDGITGLLVFDGTRFLQILEGAPEAIDNLVERLRRDRRHSALEIRDEHEIAARSFPDWSMALVRVSAGYLRARTELASMLPPGVAPRVRGLLLAMADEMARPFEME